MQEYNNYQNNNEGLYNSPVPEQKSNKKIWLLITIPILIVIIGVVVFFILNSSPKTISDNEFSQGTNIQLKENKVSKFTLSGVEHTIKINSVSRDSVNLIIQSNPIQTDIRIGEEKKFDLDNDHFYDIQVKLNSIKNGVPDIFIKKIYESACTENWDCGDWSSCSEQGSQTRTCTDLNSCGTTKNKPTTTQSCTDVCAENWSCTAWSTCANKQQTRTCTDSNLCGTTTDKPTEQQSCILQTLDCGSNTLSQETQGNQPNFDCFIDASENCEPAKLLNTITIEIFGMLSTSTAYMELKGMESNKCIYYQRTENNSVEFTDELIQQMLDGGATQEEIDQQEQTANDSAQQTVGLEKTCKFNQEDLTNMLNNWKEGSFSTEDWDVAECEGDY